MQDATHGELLARLAQAEEAVRSRDDFLAVAAHELRSPLHALGLRLAALERLAERSGEQVLRDELRKTRRSVDRYMRKAVTLLEVSKLQAGLLQPAPAPVSAADVVSHLIEDYRDEAAFHRVTLECEVDPDVTGCWDPQMIEQVLANLVINAIKYGNGTPVLIRAGLLDGNHAYFEVADRGPGIDEANRKRIFEKFERVVSRDRAGFGLGLWIVGRMVAAHHGTVEVMARPGGGALFRVVLPLHALTPQQEDNGT